MSGLKKLTKEETQALLDRTEAHNARANTDKLADRKAEALQTGKELFDLDKFGALLNLTWRVEVNDPPQSVPREEKNAYYELSYYVTYPRIQTLKEFAEKVEELRQWDLE